MWLHAALVWGIFYMFHRRMTDDVLLRDNTTPSKWAGIGPAILSYGVLKVETLLGFLFVMVFVEVLLGFFAGARNT